MDFINTLRSSYLAAATGVLLIAVTPALRDRFLAYGPRASEPSAKTEHNEEHREEHRREPNTPDQKPSFVNRLLDTIASWTVPHDYFWAFYLVSTSLSVFWLGEVFWLKGPTFQAIDRYTIPRSSSMFFEQVNITWIMMFAQGLRRLYETRIVTSPLSSKSASQMHAFHWALGVLFYIGTSMAIWIEGIPVLRHHQPSIRDLYFRSPSLRTFVGVPIFLLASGLQHDCHAHLANLKSKPGDYKVPTHPAFQSIIAPHYTAECLIYLALAIVGAPRGQILSLTLTSALIFVVVNLGVTASGTRDWYERRFGLEAVKGKWIMIPGIW